MFYHSQLQIIETLLEALDYELFLWAWHIVNTRCIYVPTEPNPLFDNSDGDCLAVIPFVDMFNHSNDYQVTSIFNL